MDLYIKALAGRDLPAKDLNGKSDPYIIFKLDGVEQKTQIQKKTLNPVWNEEFIFPDAKPTSTLKIRVYDYDRIGKDDKISKFNIAIGSLPPGRVIDRWFKFANNGSTNNGQVHMIVHYCIKGYPPFELIPIEDIPAEYRRIPPPAPPVKQAVKEEKPVSTKPYTISADGTLVINDEQFSKIFKDMISDYLGVGHSSKIRYDKLIIKEKSKN